MKWTIKYCLTCISLLGIFSTESYPQEGLFHTPDSLMETGQWREACLEYEKIIFLYESREIQTHALLQKAECYKKQHDFAQASKTLNRIYIFGLPDSVLFKTKYEKAFVFYLNQEPGKAIVELQSLQTKEWETEATARILFLSSISYLSLHQWEPSKMTAITFVKTILPEQTSHSLYVAKLEELFSEKNIPRQLSATKAKNMSRFFPGGGQFYTGKIGEGLVSLGLHASLLYFGIDQFGQHFYFTGYTAGFGLLQRIYTGNLQRVQNLVAEVNTEKNNQFYNALFQILAEASKQ